MCKDYNPFEMLKAWDKMNGYKKLVDPDKSCRESEGNLYLQTIYHKNFELERNYMRNKIKTLSADEFFYGAKA